jgi:HEAT repeat protein
MSKALILSILAAALAFGGCGTKRDDAKAGEGSAAQQDKKRAGVEKKAKQQAEEEARAKETIAKLQSADEPALLKAFDDQDRRVRRAAIELLSTRGIGGEAAIQALIPRLADHWKPVRQAAREALVKIGEPAVKPLIEAFAKDSPYKDLSYPAGRKGKKGAKPTSIRAAVKEALGDLGQIAVPALIEAISHEDDLVRRNAVGALGRMGPTAAAAAPALLLALEKDDDPVVRMNALGDLGRIDPLNPKLEPAAQKALESGDEALKKTATRVLDNIRKAKAEGGAPAEGKPAPQAAE